MLTEDKTLVAFELPVRLDQQAKTTAKRLDISKSALLRAALSQFLQRLETEGGYHVRLSTQANGE